MDDKIRNLMNKAKSAAYRAGGAAEKGFSAASEKATEIAQSAKLSKKVFDLEGEINALMQNIGEIVYQTHCGIETDDQMLEGLLYEVDGKKEELAAAQDELSDLKNTRKCPVCSTDVSKDDRYCKTCGAILD